MFMQRGNYGTQQILEPMKSPSDKELDYSSDSREVFLIKVRSLLNKNAWVDIHQI